MVVEHVHKKKYKMDLNNVKMTATTRNYTQWDIREVIEIEKNKSYPEEVVNFNTRECTRLREDTLSVPRVIVVVPT